MTRIVPDVLFNNGPTEFGQYLVIGWKVSQIVDEHDVNKNKVKVTAILTRKITNIFLGTFLLFLQFLQFYIC